MVKIYFSKNPKQTLKNEKIDFFWKKSETNGLLTHYPVHVSRNGKVISQDGHESSHD